MINAVLLEDIGQRFESQPAGLGHVAGGQDRARHQAAVDMREAIIAALRGHERNLPRFRLGMREVPRQGLGLAMAGLGYLGVGLAPGVEGRAVPGLVVGRLRVPDQVQPAHV